MAIAETTTLRPSDISQRPAFRFETWQECLQSRERLEWLLFIGKYYSDLFDESIEKILKLGRYYPHIEFLIDFDVLKALIDIDSSDLQEANLIYSWFHFTTRPFRLPEG